MNRNNPFVEGAPRILGVQHSLCLDYVEGTFTSVEAEVAECSERPISRSACGKITSTPTSSFVSQLFSIKASITPRTTGSTAHAG